MLAIAHREDWTGHVPGPHGLPGGYPVTLRAGHLALDLPAGLDRAVAIAWNECYESENGLVVDATGHARYTGRLHERFKEESPDLAAGFNTRDLEHVWRAMVGLRDRMLKRPA
jgi:hypothetical protein